MRRAARVDANQSAIVEAFRNMGWTVAHTHTVGDGFPDLVIGKRGRNLLIEVKDGSKPPSARKLTEDEEHFRLNWRGRVETVLSVEDAIILNEVYG